MSRPIKFRFWDGLKFVYSDEFVHFYEFFECRTDQEDESQQFTGLLDKNGKEIYERDRVKDELHGLGTVKFGSFSDNEFGEHWGFFIDWDEWPEFNYGFSKSRQLEIKVVGNIFE